MDKKKIIIIAFILTFIILALLVIFISSNSVYYNVSFDSDGGSIVKSQKVKKNNVVNEPNSPIKDGYTFIEWQLNGKTYNFNHKVDKNITLKAKWLKEKEEDKLVTIRFENEDGTLISSLTIKQKSKVTKPVDPMKEGYTFKGWLVNKVLYDFDSEVKDNLTLVASWEKNEVSTTKKENKKTTTKRNATKPQTTKPTAAPTTRPTTAPTTVPTTKAASYSYKWTDVAGSTIGQADLFIINKDTGKVVSGTATITYQNGASETVSISSGGKRFVKSAVKSVSNIKGN